MLENIVYNLNEVIWGVPLISILLFTHIFTTIILKFPQRHVFKGVKYMFSNRKKGDISSFNSLMTILAGMLGTGNIIGVSSAILIGGAGSIFWIFIAGILAISTKYAETYLVLKYRKKGIKKGSYIGGAMYVLREKVGSEILAKLFCIFTIISSFGIGAMIQSNSATISIVNNFSFDVEMVAIMITISAGFIIYSSAKVISKISSIIVPLSTIVFVVMQILLLFMYKNNIIPSIILILRSAFDFSAVAGGITGIVCIKALSAGLSKGMFSNEAGMGSTPIFECNVSEENIVKQSMISSTSVFIDTVLLCSITGLIIVSSGLYIYINDPFILVQNVFDIIPMGDKLLSFCLISFALASLPCWCFYGATAVKYLFDKNKFVYLYKFIYMTAIYIGCTTTASLVWDVSSIANGLMVLPNIYMIIYLYNELKINNKK